MIFQLQCSHLVHNSVSIVYQNLRYSHSADRNDISLEYGVSIIVFNLINKCIIAIIQRGKYWM